jgi:hypothetical protein
MMEGDELGDIPIDGEHIPAGEGDAPGQGPDGPVNGTAELHALLELATAKLCPNWRGNMMAEEARITSGKTMALAEATTGLINHYFPKLLAAANPPAIIFLGALVVVFAPALVSGVPRKNPDPSPTDGKGDS